MRTSFFLFLALGVLQGCGSTHYGKSSSYTRVAKREVNSAFLFRPIVEPAIIINKSEYLGGMVVNDGFFGKHSVDEEGLKNEISLMDSFNSHWKGSTLPLNNFSDNEDRVSFAFKILQTTRVDLSKDDVELNLGLPLGTTTRYSVFIYFSPILQMNHSINYRGITSKGIFQTLKLQVIVFDNFENKIAAYNSAKNHFTGAKIKQKKFDELVNHTLRGLFVKGGKAERSEN